MSTRLPIFGGVRYRFQRIWSRKKNLRFGFGKLVSEKKSRFWFRKIWSWKKSIGFGFGKYGLEKSISFSFSDGNDDDGMCLVSPVISSPPTQSENRDQFRADYFTTSRPDVPHHFWAIAHSPDWLILTKLLAINVQKCLNSFRSGNNRQAF